MLKKEDIGKKFTAVVSNQFIEGKIGYEAGVFFMCQNYLNGASCSEKYGYKYSWNIGATGEAAIRQYNLKVVEESDPFEHWQVGRKIRISGENVYTIVFRSGEVIMLKDGQGKIVAISTCAYLHKNGSILLSTQSTEKKKVEKEEAEKKQQEEMMAEIFNSILSWWRK